MDDRITVLEVKVAALETDFREFELAVSRRLKGALGVQKWPTALSIDDLVPDPSAVEPGRDVIADVLVGEALEIFNKHERSAGCRSDAIYQVLLWARERFGR